VNGEWFASGSLQPINNDDVGIMDLNLNLNFLDFEQPIAELEAKIEELRLVGYDNEINIQEEIERLHTKCVALTESIFSALTPWQISQLSRHPQRPYLLDYTRRLFDDFHELHGDRTFADDRAMVGGLARIDGRPVMVIGHQKGRDTKEKILRNFGMPRPEGYRKALRLMEMAERFGLPILTFIDTPGAYPGVGAEERGQSEAIARNLREMARLRTPILCTVVGEGGSGGALAIGVGDWLGMLQFSTYSVISRRAAPRSSGRAPTRPSSPPSRWPSRLRNSWNRGWSIRSSRNHSAAPIATRMPLPNRSRPFWWNGWTHSAG
jgi:acetyl-CoA carboxylase carboxyl transferase subunit alpha